MLVVIASVILGYLLDILGVYNWNYGYRRSRERYFFGIARLLYSERELKARREARRLRVIANHVLAEFWANDPDAYARAVEEPRAKWVLALEIAPILLLSGGLWLGMASFNVYVDVANDSSSEAWLYSELQAWLGSPALRYLLQASLSLGAVIGWYEVRRRGMELLEFGDLVGLAAVESHLARPSELRAAAAQPWLLRRRRV